MYTNLDFEKPCRTSFEFHSHVSKTITYKHEDYGKFLHSVGRLLFRSPILQTWSVDPCRLSGSFQLYPEPSPLTNPTLPYRHLAPPPCLPRPSYRPLPFTSNRLHLPKFLLPSFRSARANAVYFYELPSISPHSQPPFKHLTCFPFLQRDSTYTTQRHTTKNAYNHNFTVTLSKSVALPYVT